MAVHRRFRCSVPLVCLLILFVLCSLLAARGSDTVRPWITHARDYKLSNAPADKQKPATAQGDDSETSQSKNTSSTIPHDSVDDDSTINWDFTDDETEDEISGTLDRGDYREIFSLTTTRREYFPIFFAGKEAYNPNIIPHPTRHDMWIVVAQHEQSREDIATSEELICEAGFLDGVLVCSEEPTVLPIAPSIRGQCEDDLAYLNFRFGPRDARMFYGPDGPMIIYGSQSQYACLGIWVQDIRMLLDAFRLERFAVSKIFKTATEVQRPPPWHGMEKNFFFFWDAQGKAFIHNELYPSRVFAQIDFDGSVGEDLAPLTENEDQACMAQYMPYVGPEWESIHQATNSLSITLCERADPKCVPDDSNTFIMHIFHHKSYYDYHGIYEPYVILFRRSAPFALHAISQRPLWIHGRAELTALTGSLQYAGRPASDIPEGHTEMFYVTSVSWRGHDQRYHGYADDVLFLAFGIEDTRAAGIDVRAGDLLQDLAIC